MTEQHDHDHDPALHEALAEQGREGGTIFAALIRQLQQDGDPNPPLTAARIMLTNAQQRTADRQTVNNIWQATP
ncbi:hypothetical protein H7J06_24540 [Mycobacterium hodleri]|uniref:hypothetical protein n=1 Tax=Mycolicibacterium hodleri TaxID=49897 RepID=UPI0021F2D445|nr:hypothetical protein [Mycolicibacterium hodleri]MCV7136145.1 hypothetical protein [Mycolicibacterium hodleri]